MKTLTFIVLFFSTAVFGLRNQCPLKGCDCGKICTRTFDCVHGQHKKRSRRNVLAFPATHESLLIENQYANEEHLVRFQTIQDLRSLEPLLHNRTVAIESPLPANRRLCRPEVNQFLYALGTAHQMFSPSPIWVSSAVRPVQVQRRLHLRNAAPARGERASPHETGATVDLKRQGRADDAWMVAYLSVEQAAGRVHVIEEKSCWHIFVRRP